MPNRLSDAAPSWGSSPPAYRIRSSSTTLPIVSSHPSAFSVSHWYNEPSRWDSSSSILSICSLCWTRLASSRSCSRWLACFSSVSFISYSAVIWAIWLLTAVCLAAFSFSATSNCRSCSSTCFVFSALGCHCRSSFTALSALFCSASSICKRSSDSWRQLPDASITAFLFFVRSSSRRFRSFCWASCFW